eukprot:jgi/Botrbrau1/22258/Bobra.0138s0020.1
MSWNRGTGPAGGASSGQRTPGDPEHNVRSPPGPALLTMPHARDTPQAARPGLPKGPLPVGHSLAGDQSRGGPLDFLPVPAPRPPQELPPAKGQKRRKDEDEDFDPTTRSKPVKKAKLAPLPKPIGPGKMHGREPPLQQGAVASGRVYEELRSMHEALTEFDSKSLSKLFANPVTEDIAPGYFSVITHPMDLQTIGKKIREREYEASSAGLKAFLQDVNLMAWNCEQYNADAPDYVADASRLRERAKVLFNRTRNNLEGVLHMQ